MDENVKMRIAIDHFVKLDGEVCVAVTSDVLPLGQAHMLRARGAVAILRFEEGMEGFSWDGDHLCGEMRLSGVATTAVRLRAEDIFACWSRERVAGADGKEAVHGFVRKVVPAEFLRHTELVRDYLSDDDDTPTERYVRGQLFREESVVAKVKRALGFRVVKGGRS